MECFSCHSHKRILKRGKDHEKSLMKMEIKLPKNYPFKPLKIFISNIVNIQDDLLCSFSFSFIDPENWTPSLTLSFVIKRVRKMINDGEVDGKFNFDFSSLQSADPKEYQRKLAENAEKLSAKKNLILSKIDWKSYFVFILNCNITDEIADSHS